MQATFSRRASSRGEVAYRKMREIEWPAASENVAVRIEPAALPAGSPKFAWLLLQFPDIMK